MNKNIDDYILQNYKIKTNSQLAKECGCCEATISKHRKKLGISMKELNSQLRGQTSYILSQFGKKTSKVLSEELNCSSAFIIKIWNENNLKSSKNVYKLKEDYFSKIDTAEKAYFLGFICADGCIYRREGHQIMLSISINKKDIELLNFLKKELETEKPIYIGEDNMVTLQITSNQIGNDLLRLGVITKKTFDMSLEEVFNKIPKDKIKDFILGYFDGDGSISLSQKLSISRSHVRIVAPLKSLKIFQTILLNEIYLLLNFMQDKDHIVNLLGKSIVKIV